MTTDFRPCRFPQFVSLSLASVLFYPVVKFIHGLVEFLFLRFDLEKITFVLNTPVKSKSQKVELCVLCLFKT